MSITFEDVLSAVESTRDDGHSRFDEKHYRNCESCYGEHLDFMQDQAQDERLDARMDEAEYQNEFEED